MHSSQKDWLSIQSASINLLRFPLAIAVIFIHLNPKTIGVLEADFSVASGKGIVNVLFISISNVLAQTAVPIFFLISGFFFFHNVQKFTLATYKKKLSSRIKTLIIPYFCWNTLVFCMTILGKTLKIGNANGSLQLLMDYIKDVNWHFLYDSHIFHASDLNILGNEIYQAGPIDAPLWFLRDLIFMVILTPLIFILIKKTKIYGILLLCFFYITRIWIEVPGLSITAFFYFSLGTYFAINNINIVYFAQKINKIFLPLSILFFIICVTWDGRNTYIGANVMPLYILTTIFVVFNIATYLVKKYKLKSPNILLNCCFFVFASHTIFILSLIKNCIHYIMYGQSSIVQIFNYLITPFVTAYICVAIYYFLTKYFPRLALPLTGYR
ncbi:MAG: acyltransferase family protein [Bacteroides sp.]|nr:acyltransferase family protein [Bacteroides sp.]